MRTFATGVAKFGPALAQKARGKYGAQLLTGDICVLAVKSIVSRQPRLCAFLSALPAAVADGEAQTDTDRRVALLKSLEAMCKAVLRVELGRTLPLHMIPAVAMVLDTDGAEDGFGFPVTSTGKVDKKALRTALQDREIAEISEAGKFQK